MRVLIDSDVVLDVALDREPFAQESTAAIDWCQKAPASALVAWHTISNIYYLLRAARGDGYTRGFLADMLRFTVVVAGGNEAVRRALSLKMNDFEDALQVTSALDADAELIITRNIRDYRGSPLPARTPAEFLARVQAT